MRMWKGEREKRDRTDWATNEYWVSKCGNGMKREARRNTGGRNETGKEGDLMVGLVPAAEARGPRFVCLSFGSALSSALSCSWRISHRMSD
ncbi:unnamed protein product [Lasius platythorax]|uniref:Uncharacterized protein n=1 Tax=Lasius platythorax TaxID=488582 RepID=A0AAV2NXQ7_9HYME